MAVSAAFTFAGAAGSLQRLEVAASTAWSATLDNLAGVDTCEWEIVSTDETTAPSDYTLVTSGPRNSTVSSTSLTAGTAAILRCLVNRGRPDEASARAKLLVLTAGGLPVGAFDEEFEHDPVYGSTAIANEAARAAGSIGANPSVTTLTASSYVQAGAGTKRFQDAAPTAAGHFTVTADGRFQVFQGAGAIDVPTFNDRPDVVKFPKQTKETGATSMAESAIGAFDGQYDVEITGVSIVVNEAITASDTDYIAISIRWRDPADPVGTNGLILYMTTETSGSGGLGDWPQFQDPGVGAFASLTTVPPGSIITMEATKTGSVDFPGCLVVISGTRA